jgi:hypothetical protein
MLLSPGLKAPDMTAWAAASNASAGPGQPPHQISQALQGRPSYVPTTATRLRPDAGSISEQAQLRRGCFSFAFFVADVACLQSFACRKFDPNAARFWSASASVPLSPPIRLLGWGTRLHETNCRASFLAFLCPAVQKLKPTCWF